MKKTIDKPRKLHLDEIKLEERLRVRAAIDQETIKDYCDAMEEGATFPPVDVFEIDGGYFLVDGFHRYHAARRLDFKDILGTVHQGSGHEALEFALKSNQAHGLRRTNADKRHAVQLALEMWPGMSSRSLADLCGVHHDTVEEVRQVAESATSTRKGKDGKAYPARAERMPRPADPERDDDRKDAKESADSDRKQDEPEWIKWQSFQEFSGYTSENIKSLEALPVPHAHQQSASAICTQLAQRLSKLADKLSPTTKAAASTKADPGCRKCMHPRSLHAKGMGQCGYKFESGNTCACCEFSDGKAKVKRTKNQEAE